MAVQRTNDQSPKDYPKLKSGNFALPIMESCKDFRSQHSRIRRREYSRELLANCFDWGTPPVIPDPDQHQIMELVLSELVDKNDLKVGEIHKTARKYTQKYLAQPEQKFTAITFLSFWWNVEPTAFRCGQSAITLGGKLKSGLKSVLQELKVPEFQEGGNFFDSHTLVQIEIPGRSHDGAIYQAITDLNCFRGLLLARCTSAGYEHHESPLDEGRPFNLFTWGPHMTLHNSDWTLLSADCIWEPIEEYTHIARSAASTIFPSITDTVMMLKEINSSALILGDFANLCELYAHALDTTDLNAALVRSVAVLEQMSTMRHIDIPDLISPLFDNPSIVRADLALLLTLRNRYIHALRPTNYSDGLLSLLNRYLARLILYCVQEVTKPTPDFTDLKKFKEFCKVQKELLKAQALTAEQGTWMPKICSQSTL